MLPWLENDKFDTSISIRKYPSKKYFVWDLDLIDSWWAWDRDIEIWFEAKYVHVYTVYKSWTSCMSEAYVTNLNWTTTVSTNYMKYWFNDMYTLWSWDNSSIEVVYIQRDATRYREYWITINPTSITFNLWDEWSLPPWTAIHIFAIW